MKEWTNIELLYYTGGGEKAKEEEMLDFITELVNKMDENYNSMLFMQMDNGN